MSGYFDGSLLLLGATLGAMLLFVMLVSSGSMLTIVTEGGYSSGITRTILRVKILLLRFSGASISDLETQDQKYLKNSTLNDTYLLENKTRCFRRRGQPCRFWTDP